jgi:hypothetical protein
MGSEKHKAFDTNTLYLRIFQFSHTCYCQIFTLSSICLTIRYNCAHGLSCGDNIDSMWRYLTIQIESVFLCLYSTRWT